MPVSLLPGGDAFVHGVGVIATAALGQVRFSVEDIDRMVVSSVLLGGEVANGPAVASVAMYSESQGSYHCLMIN